MDAPRPIVIRDEQPGDVPGVRRVVEAAFKGRAEADLVDKLRANGRFAISLVAAQGRAVVGHVLLTDVALAGNHLAVRGAGLAPLAVRPTFQRRGIGTLLMRAAPTGSSACSAIRRTTCDSVSSPPRRLASPASSTRPRKPSWRSSSRRVR